MEDRETPRMRKYGESKMTRIMMATVPHFTSGSGLRKFQADRFLFDGVYLAFLFSGIVTEPAPQRLELLQLMNGRGLYGNLKYRWQLSIFVLNFQ